MTTPNRPCSPPDRCAPGAAAGTGSHDILTIPAELRSAGRARAWVRERALAAGLSRDAADDVELAVGEAATNAIVHGCRRTAPTAASVTIVAGIGAAWLCVEVWDPGEGFDPSAVHSTNPSDGDALGGRGLPLMQALMDDVTLRYYPGRGMCVRLRRRLE